MLFLQIRRGYIFESETDTEVIPKLMQHIYDKHKQENDPLTFLQIVELVARQIVSWWVVIDFDRSELVILFFFETQLHCCSTKVHEQLTNLILWFFLKVFVRSDVKDLHGASMVVYMIKLFKSVLQSSSRILGKKLYNILFRK